MDDVGALIRLTLAILLGAAAIAKAARFRDFANALHQYPVPGAAIPWLGGTVVGSEALIAIGLASGYWFRGFLLMAVALLLVFSGAAATAMTRTPNIDCGCLGGVLRISLSWTMVGANILLASSAVLAATTATPVSAPLPPGAASRHTSDVFVLWASATLITVAYWLVAYATSVHTLMRRYAR